MVDSYRKKIVKKQSLSLQPTASKIPSKIVKLVQRVLFPENKSKVN